MVDSGNDEFLTSTKGSILANNYLVKSFVSGLVSSTITTVTYQPLELLKTRIQIKDHSQKRIYGRLTSTAFDLLKTERIGYLWRGTGASLLRSGPGVSSYYAILGLLQTKLSEQSDKPDSPTQAFYFGFTARSFVSFALLPVTVVKVRYESGKFKYATLTSAIKTAYLHDGWIGVTPTILRDTLFSGFYYMIYTHLKSSQLISQCPDGTRTHARNFLCGVVSGVVASIVTNPLDVIKTKIQVQQGGNRESFKSVVSYTLSQPRGYLAFLDGVVPRGVRRTLIAATTWTIYELVSAKIKI